MTGAGILCQNKSAGILKDGYYIHLNLSQYVILSVLSNKMTFNLRKASRHLQHSQTSQQDVVMRSDRTMRRTVRD